MQQDFASSRKVPQLSVSFEISWSRQTQQTKANYDPQHHILKLVFFANVYHYSRISEFWKSSYTAKSIISHTNHL